MNFLKIVGFFGLTIFSITAVSATEKVCSTTSDCEENEFCKKKLDDCDGKGVCTVKSEMCSMDFKPVCGCDHETYSNACNAESKGISVSDEGECSSD